MKTAIIASLIASAAAFAPAKDASRTTALNMAFEDELGAQAPLGFFDPLGIVADGDAEKFERLRYVEIKHGRIFFAFVGALELAVMKDITGGEFPGDFRNGALDFGWDSFDEETKLTKRAVELNQGRAAQMGLLGLMVHDKLGNVENFFPN
ncbi:Fucoxanthin-chlorophyll a-c binding protein [Seminavis robusta]|uniref:Fucoxanthin-chlorophyll a-c binding protein n=1 Tax=Seminavis robusta TaxID=568900 RepID=A0A9N8DT14_9STRA|nr:Fucoxanthin-chlorophyll a-c binding protein [Seminavis robusta]|eukprot:Sro267_g103520.1 Fucoxanthin-chlorophyll a-c binding protein (151) ;mRNA; r:66506-67101